MNPETLRFTKTHEWVQLDGDIATVGISDFAVKELTDLVYIELPQPGQTVQAGETFGEVESVKAVSDLYAPVSGEVIEVNQALEDDLALLSDDTYGQGWVAKIKVTDTEAINGMMDYQTYQNFTQNAGS